MTTSGKDKNSRSAAPGASSQDDNAREDIQDIHKAGFSKELLQSVINTAFNNINFLLPVRNEAGDITDLRFELSSQGSREYSGPGRTGRLYSELHGSAAGLGVMQQLIRVIETGENANFELPYTGEGYDGWYRIQASKFDEGVLTVSENITERKKTEAEIIRLKEEIARQAEDKYRVLFNSMEEGFGIIELTFDDKGKATNYRFLEVNDAYLRHIGQDDPTGRSGSEPDAGSYWLDIYEQVSRTGESVQFEHHREDSGRWYEYFATRVGEAESRQVAILFSDITDRKQLEQQQDFLLKLSDILRAQLTNTAAMQTEAMKLLADHFDVMHAACYEGEPDGNTFTLTAIFERDAGSLPMQFRLSDFLPTVADDYRKGIARMVTDTEQEAFPEACRARGIRAWLVVPFVHEGRLVAVIELHAKTPRKWTSSELQLPEHFAERIYAAVERSRAEERLQLANTRFMLAEDASNGFVYEWRNEMATVFRSEGFTRFLGYAPGEIGDTEDGWRSLIHPDDTQIAAGLGSNLPDSDHYMAEYRVRHKDGHYVYVLDRGMVTRGSRGDIVHIIGSLVDITKQKLFAEELGRQVSDRTTELKRSNEDLQQFAHVASHDLKEPVRKIKLYTNRLIDEHGQFLNEKANSFLHKIVASTDRMASMIDGVLRYSKLESLMIPLEQVDLNLLMQQVAADLDLMMKQKKAVIHISRLPVISGYPELLYQLFYNLLLNALKFSRTDLDAEIDISSEEVKLDYKVFNKIRLADNGIGFDPRFAEEIFKTFTKLHPVQEYEGSGLGLALCKKIVERHDGFITATGERGNGAIFTILLPAR